MSVLDVFVFTPKHPIRYLVYVLLEYSYRCYILIQQYELIFRYHFLFCVLLNRNTSYRSFSGFLTSLRISKFKGEAHRRRFVLLRHRDAEQEVRSHSAVTESLSFLSLPGLLRLNYQKIFSYNQQFFVFKTQKSA